MSVHLGRYSTLSAKRIFPFERRASDAMMCWESLGEGRSLGSASGEDGLGVVGPQVLRQWALGCLIEKRQGSGGKKASVM